MSKINESQKRRLAVLAGLKNRDAAKLEEAKERAERRKRIAEQVENMLEDDDMDMDDMGDSEELEEGGKHTKKGSAFVKAKRKANMDLGLKEMDMSMEDDEGDEMEMDDMGGDMEMGGDDMEMGDDDGMGPGSEMGGGDEELATRIITRVVDAIKAELGVDVTVDSGAPQTNVPGAGMDDMDGDDMGHEEPDEDDMGGMPDGDEDDEMLHEEDDSYKAGGKASKPSVAKVDHAHPDHKMKSKGGLKEARERLTKEVAAEIAKETLALIRNAAKKRKNK